MKVAHITAYCHLGSAGGTERYVRDLMLGLNRLGHANQLVWLTPDPPLETPVCPDAALYVWPRSPMRLDDPPPDLAERAARWLSGAQAPDVIHFHTLGRSEAVLAEQAQRLSRPYVFTYHSPAWTCRRDTLLLWGLEVCDGEVRALRCSACKVQERTGGPRWLGYAAAAASAAVTPVRTLLPDRARRRLAFTAESALYGHCVRRFLRSSRVTVACAEWSIPVLRANGAASDRMVHLPQGVPDDFPPATPVATGETFTVGYIGRMNEVKGIHLLVEAFRRTSYDRARLKIYGWSDAPSLAAYGCALKRLAGEDPRIEFIAEKKPADMPAAYAELSLLAIPSVWLETGPLTLLEALQSGVRVYGSARIGQRGLLEKYGRVIDPNTPDAWARALAEAFAEHQSGRWYPVTLREPLLTMRDVAVRMASLYRGVLAS